MQKEIGTSGILRPGGWWAERASHIKVETNRVRKYDVFKKRKRRYRLLLWAVNMLVIVGALLLLPYYWLTGIFLFTSGCIGMALVYLLVNDRGYEDYTDGYLAPAIVISSKPVRILVLTPIGFTGKTVWGVCVIPIGEGDWTYSIGDKAPCSVWFEELDINCRMFKMFHPQPLVWATSDRVQLDTAVSVIDEEEWLLLQEIALQVAKLTENIPYEVQIKRESARQIRFAKLLNKSVLKAMRG